MKLFDIKTPLLARKVNKYGTIPFEIVEYTSNFVEEFNLFLMKDVAEKSFTFSFNKKHPALVCKGDKGLIEMAENGEFYNLKIQLENYPFDNKDSKVLAFKQHLLFSAVKSGNLNTVLVVLNMLNNFNDLIKVRKYLANNLQQFKDEERDFFWKHPKITDYKIMLYFLETIALSCQYEAVSVDKIDDPSFIKKFIEKLNKIYLKEMSQEVENRLDDENFCKQKALESNILSKLEHALFSEEAANNSYQIANLIRQTAIKYEGKKEFNNLFNSLNFYINACSAYERLQLEKGKYNFSVENANKL